MDAEHLADQFMDHLELLERSSGFRYGNRSLTFPTGLTLPAFHTATMNQFHHHPENPSLSMASVIPMENGTLQKVNLNHWPSDASGSRVERHRMSGEDEYWYDEGFTMESLTKDRQDLGTEHPSPELWLPKTTAWAERTVPRMFEDTPVDDEHRDDNAKYLRRLSKDMNKSRDRDWTGYLIASSHDGTRASDRRSAVRDINLDDR